MAELAVGFRIKSLQNGRRKSVKSNKAYFLYVSQDHTERAKLLNIVLSNCSIRRCKSLTYLSETFRFDLPKSENRRKWRARRDSNSRPSASKADALSS